MDPSEKFGPPLRDEIMLVQMIEKIQWGTNLKGVQIYIYIYLFIVYCILYIAWFTGNDPANEETSNST